MSQSNPARRNDPDLTRSVETEALAVADRWDAGDMGCGEVLILLRMRMQALTPGEVFKLTTRDLGAPEEMPSWCRMTGRRLLRADHPDYWIEQRPNS
jgi:tRNA 2-thiouridine synthesizing protein A